MNADIIHAMCCSPDASDGQIFDAIQDTPRQKMYSIRGETRSWEEFASWHYMTFSSLAMALAVCVRLNRWCKAQGVMANAGLDIWPEGVSCPLDPKCRVLHFGVEYKIEEIEVI